MSVSVFIKEACTTVGEGPHWEHSSQSLLFVDISNGEVHRYNTITKNDSKIKLDGTVGFVVPRRSGGYIVGLNRSITFLNWDNITAKSIAEVEIGCDTRFNDGKCDPAGRLWAGTMGNIRAEKPFVPNQGALYSLDRERALHTHAQLISISNGLAWSHDNKSMYYIDSPPKHLYAFDYEISSGKTSNQRVAVDFNKFDQDIGVPDGMCIDQEGMLWVACFGGARVVRVNPNNGTMLKTVTFPAKRITSCCFGGPNYDELYVTSARSGCTPEELSAYPLAGSIFKVTELGVKGGPGQEYCG